MPYPIEQKLVIAVASTAIVTARSAPAHERVITTLEHWGVDANEVFFLGGMQKDRIWGRRPFPITVAR